MELREALEQAVSCLPPNAIEAREHIERLLKQKSDTHETLVDECQVAIYG